MTNTSLIEHLMTIAYVVTAIALTAVEASAQKGRRGYCDTRYKSVICVPVAKDVDCKDGGGNGPRYVQGPFSYKGSDPYRLDRNKDGTACEPYEDFRPAR
jgi:uncharacterized membrane protein